MGRAFANPAAHCTGDSQSPPISGHLFPSVRLTGSRVHLMPSPWERPPEAWGPGCPLPCTPARGSRPLTSLLPAEAPCPAPDFPPGCCPSPPPPLHAARPQAVFWSVGATGRRRSCPVPVVTMPTRAPSLPAAASVSSPGLGRWTGRWVWGVVGHRAGQVAFLPVKTLLSTKQIQKASSHSGSGKTSISDCAPAGR